MDALHRVAVVDQELPEEEGRHVGAPEQLGHAHGLVHGERPDAVENAGGLGSAGGERKKGERRLEEAANSCVAREIWCWAVETRRRR